MYPQSNGFSLRIRGVKTQAYSTTLWELAILTQGTSDTSTYAMTHSDEFT